MDKIIYLLLTSLVIVSINPCYSSTNKKPARVKHSRARLKQPEAEATTKDNNSFPITGTFDIVSNYLFRGISQSNNIPAVQGGLTYTFKKTGIYFNVWGSNVYMPVPESSNTATLELDTSAGVTNSINDKTSYDIHFVRYFYPKATFFQYNELIGSLTYYFLTGLIGYSNNVFNSGSSGTYYNLAVKFPIPSCYVYFEDVSVNAGVGYYSLPKAAGNSYKDYALSLNKVIKNYTLTVQWADTDHHLLNNSLDHAHIIGMITATF